MKSGKYSGILSNLKTIALLSLHYHLPNKLFKLKHWLKRVLGQVKSTGKLLRGLKFIFSMDKNAAEKVTEVFSNFHNDFSLAAFCPTFFPHSHPVVSLLRRKFSIASKGKFLIFFNSIAMYNFHKKSLHLQKDVFADLSLHLLR